MAASSRDSAKTERIEVRVSPESKELISRACELAGLTVSGFVTYVAVREAMNFLQRYEMLRFSEQDTLAMVTSLDHPPEPSAALRALLGGPATGD